MRKRTLAREHALKILYSIELSSETINTAMKDFWSENKSQDCDATKAFCELLVNGVQDNLGKIDSFIATYAENWDIKRIAIIDKNILRIAIFEMCFLTDIPPKVSINEAVELAKRYGDIDSGKFVNGILDKINKVAPRYNAKTS